MCFSVFNTGKGIPTKEIDKVFDRLYRGEYARKSPGSGLGLTISQKIAELHGGNVTIYSAENYGTTVQMRIKG
ncbi:Sensor histidine kinase WalK [subsurface metagenome]